MQRAADPGLLGAGDRARGDDGEAKGTAARLAAELGFEPVDAGLLRNARLLEPPAMLWISLAYVQGLGPGIAFKLLRR